MAVVQPSLQFEHVAPFGAIVRDGGVQFVVYSRNATAMRLLVYNRVWDREPADVIHFDPDSERWGDVWNLFVPGLKPGQLYHLQADGPNDLAKGCRFDGRARLIDPWTQALAGDFQPPGADGVLRPPKCVVVDHAFEWQGDRPINRPLSESIIYEMHVRGFTQHRSSDVEHPGTYLGVIEKIPYLQSLGITAVELMPVHEFPINAPSGVKEDRSNYWGYDPMAFFSPHRGYVSSREPGAQVREFKQMVRALHQAGIEVILDVVFNHTCEGNEYGPTISFKGLENSTYYMLTDDGTGYRNYSGCGNTFNSNHPVTSEFIFQCLRHWVLNYHVDGFRFDLASILSRGRKGEMLSNAPIVERIAEDPVLADTKIIAEAWDAAGAYQVGSFSSGRWAEWNGRYRDDVRRYWRGDPHLAGALATRLTGSSDLYLHSGRKPYHSVNFVISHDGFTMNDLLSYNHKHNDANGEGNRDGDNNNLSFNYGVEGPTGNKAIETLRERQIKNFFATLMFSLGTPMILAGDESRRTQRGNNNAYCQDNVLSWFNWRLIEKHPDIARFVRGLIEFRRRQATIRRGTFKTGRPPREGAYPDVSWWNPQGGGMHWDGHDTSLVCLLSGVATADSHEEDGVDVLMFMHPGHLPRKFNVPETVRSRPWTLFVDTAAASPFDIFPNGTGPAMGDLTKFEMDARSTQIYVAPPYLGRRTEVTK